MMHRSKVIVRVFGGDQADRDQICLYLAGIFLEKASNIITGESVDLASAIRNL